MRLVFLLLFFCVFLSTKILGGHGDTGGRQAGRSGYCCDDDDGSGSGMNYCCQMSNHFLHCTIYFCGRPHSIQHNFCVHTRKLYAPKRPTERSSRKFGNFLWKNDVKTFHETKWRQFTFFSSPRNWMKHTLWCMSNVKCRINRTTQYVRTRIRERR